MANGIFGALVTAYVGVWMWAVLTLRRRGQ